jgi:hypothetical protein
VAVVEVDGIVIYFRVTISHVLRI